MAKRGHWLMALAAGLLAGACGDGSAGVDAGLIVLFDAAPPPPDAYVCPWMVCGESCIDTTTDWYHCGACDHPCTPVANCESSVCSCPGAFMPTSVTDADAAVGSFGGSTTLRARTTIIGTDGLTHRFTVSWDPASVELDTDLDLAASPSAGASVRYNTDGAGSSGNFRFVAGTLHLTRVCAEGVTGTVTGAKLAETAFGPGGGMEIPDGCSFADLDVTFDLGPACGTFPDAGVPEPDAGTPDAGTPGAG